MIFSSVLTIAAAGSAAAQETAFHIDPAESTVKFTVGDVLHTVHGTFQVKHGAFELEAGGKMSGEIVVDAASGDSGSGVRDRKMNKEVLEVARYPEISFRPERVDGAVGNSGKASLMVHGIFSIHGVDREITVPASLETTEGHWSALVHFTVPYEKWGMKNPSTLFLKVNDTVEIDLAAAGSVVRNTAATSQK
jgi:polyisoprenoid-binding protein YceI